MSITPVPSTSHVAGDTGHVTDHDAIATMLKSQRAGAVWLDDFTDSGDDAKLAAAISYAGAQTYPPAIKLAARLHNLTQPIGRPFDGWTLEGPIDSWKSGAGALTSGAVVNISLTPRTGEPAGYWLESTASGTVWNWAVRNIYFSGTNTTQFARIPGSGAILQGFNFHSLQFNGFRSVFGNSSEKFATQIGVIDGYWSIEGCSDTACRIGGSDNRGLWSDGLNIDSGIDVTASPKYHMIFDFLDKSNIGPIYFNCDDKGWRGVKFLGGSGNGGGLSMTGAVVEGRNATNPALGELVTVQGGWPVLNHCTIDCGMTAPVSGEVGMVSCIGSTAGVTLNNCTFELASGQDPTKVPCVHIGTGARANITGSIPWQRDTGSPSWGTNLPRLEVTADAGTVNNTDASMNRVAV